MKSFARHRIIAVVCGLLALAALVPFVARRGRAEEGGGKGGPAGSPALAAPEVEVAAAGLKTLERQSEIVGRIESPNTVEIRARVEGFLEQQLFTDGALVKKDQILFKIEAKPYRIALIQAQADLARARATLTAARKGVTVLKAKGDLMTAQAALIRAGKDLARERPLAQADAASKEDFDAAEANFKEAEATEAALRAAYEQTQINQATDIELAAAAVKSAEAAVDSAELKLSYTDVRSPIDGRIGRARQLPGALVGKDMATPTLLATVSPITPMWATWCISETEYLAMADGDGASDQDLNDKVQKLELLLADGRLYAYPGRINFVDRAIDPQTATLAMRAEFPNPKGLLREGQYCRVRTTRRPKEPSLIIPERAVQSLQGQTFVFVIDGQSRAQQRPVQLGERIGAEREIIGGLQAGEQVVVGGVQNIVMPGLTVKAVPAGSGTAVAENRE